MFIISGLSLLEINLFLTFSKNFDIIMPMETQTSDQLLLPVRSETLAVSFYSYFYGA